MGKNSAPPPDYTPLAEASAESARIMGELGQDQLAFARQQYDDTLPTLQNIADQQIAAQNEQLRQGRDYYDYSVDTYRPLEQGLVAQARDFNTDAYREQLASQAAADTGLAFGRTQDATNRQMAAMGVNPNSGRFASINAANDLGLAAARAGAMNSTRQQAEQLGFARQMDTANLGRGLPSASLAAYGGAQNAGNAAGANVQSAGQNYIGNMAVGSGTIASGQQMNMQGLSNILNAQTNAYVNSNDSFLGDLGGLLGGGARLYSSGIFSDRRLKTNIKQVGADERTELALYEFEYINWPGKRFVGVMADEVEVSHPNAVDSSGSYKMVDYGQLGIEFKEAS